MHFGEVEDVIQLQRVVVLIFGRGIVAIGSVPVVVGDRDRLLVEPAWESKVIGDSILNSDSNSN